MIILRSKKKIQWGNNPSESSEILYMRIPAPSLNFLTGLCTINHQYYSIEDDGFSYVRQAFNEELPLEMYDLLVSEIPSEKNKLNSQTQHRAYYLGALSVINSRQTFNTSAADWEIIEIDESNPDYEAHTTQIMK